MQIRIKGYSFSITTPFAEGSVITRAEAQALNDLRAENIGNNLRKLVNDELALVPDGAMIPQDRLEAIQAKISAYDHGYQFQERHTPKPRLGDIEREALGLARERVEEFQRRLGAQIGSDQFEELVAEQAKLPSILELARERVTAKRQALADSLADL